MFEDDRRLGEWEKWWKEGHARNRHTHTQTNKKKNGEFAFKIIKTQEARPPATSKHILFIFIECLFGKQCVSVGLKGCHNTARAPGEHNNKRRSPQRYLSQTCGSFFYFFNGKKRGNGVNAKDVWKFALFFCRKIVVVASVVVVFFPPLEINRVGTVALLPWRQNAKKKKIRK